MDKSKQHILNELKTIEKECMKKGITASEWVAKYTEDYHRKYPDNTRQTTNAAKESYGRKSRWAAWLERVNDI